MPVKKVDVRTTCPTCRTEIICRMSDYSNFENKLQWQNEDGTAHYSTNNGKKFVCSIPKTGNEMFEKGDVVPKTSSGNLNKEWD